MEIVGEGNAVSIGDNIKCAGFIKGNGNTVVIETANAPSSLFLNIEGNDNVVSIRAPHKISDLRISIGSHVAANDTELSIGRMFSSEPGCVFVLGNSRNKLLIGEGCMFSNGITMRCGDAPHLIFDMNTGDYLDRPRALTIGDEVWAGERCYFTKGAGVARGSIVSACSVVTRTFSEPHVVLGGNPAKIIRSGYKWLRNPHMLEKGSIYEASYQSHLRALDDPEA